MTWFRCIGGNGGGGGTDIEFTATQLWENPTKAGDVTLSEDYHNFDFLQIVTLDSNNKYYTHIVTPSVLDAAFTLGGRIHFCAYSNQYISLTNASNTSWTVTGFRNVWVYSVTGLTANCTVTETNIYTATVLSDNFVPVTSATSLFDYDLIFYATNCSNANQLVINRTPIVNFRPLGDYCGQQYGYLQKYDAGSNQFTVTEYEMSSNIYLTAIGVKFT